MRRKAIAIGMLFLGAAAGSGRYALPAADPAPPSLAAPSFQDEIRPMFQAKCVRCHGGKATRGDLDLTTPAGVLKGGQSGPVIVPGKPDESLLYEKVHGGKMPPRQEGPAQRGRGGHRPPLDRGGAPGSARAKATAAAPPTQHDVAADPAAPLHGLPRPAPAGRRAWTCTPARPCSAAANPARPSFRASPTRAWSIKKIRAGKMPPRDRLVEACVKPVGAGRDATCWPAGSRRARPKLPSSRTSRPRRPIPW